MSETNKVNKVLLLTKNVFTGRGCAAAALRLWLLPDSDLPPIEMCGEKALNEHWQYITQGQSARISFTSADKAIGAQVSDGNFGNLWDYSSFH